MMKRHGAFKGKIELVWQGIKRITTYSRAGLTAGYRNGIFEPLSCCFRSTSTSLNEDGTAFIITFNFGYAIPGLAGRDGVAMNFKFQFG